MASAPTAPDVKPATQMVHWLFAMGDTLAVNVFRALGVLGTHGEQRHEVEVEMANKDIGSPKGLLGWSIWPAASPRRCDSGRRPRCSAGRPFGMSTSEWRCPSGGSPGPIYNVFNHCNRDRIPMRTSFAR